MNKICRNYMLSFVVLSIALMTSSCEPSRRHESTSPTSSSESRSDDDDELLKRLRNKKVIADYKVVGDLEMDVLTYEDCVVGDAEHFIFKDARGAEYTFDMNSTNTELCDFEGGPSRKHINKKFKVIWRNLKIKQGVPDDYMLMEEMKEILHLEERR
ncbi:MAG: hypothetical protein ACKO66_02440 [Flavobacteriales bacterium]